VFTFWDLFWLFAIFIPLTILWVTCVIDIAFKRDDLTGFARAGWVLLIIILPAIGSLAYLAFGGAGKGVRQGVASEEAPRDEAMRLTGRAP
jgi:hypothetical protein